MLVREILKLKDQYMETTKQKLVLSLHKIDTLTYCPRYQSHVCRFH
jgi:hypothetical protein